MEQNRRCSLCRKLLEWGKWRAHTNPYMWVERKYYCDDCIDLVIFVENFSV